MKAVQIKIIGNLEEMKQYFDDDCLLPEYGGTSDWVFDPVKEFGLKDD